jgi:hypothetical protein
MRSQHPAIDAIRDMRHDTRLDQPNRNLSRTKPRLREQMTPAASNQTPTPCKFPEVFLRICRQLQQALQYHSKVKCPHCGKNIPRRVIVAESGRIGGKKTLTNRGSEYFVQLQAKRKTRAGGRPKKADKKETT